MQNRHIIRTLLCSVVMLLSMNACKQHSIQLGIVRHTPVYMHNDKLYGENIKSMEEVNAFILATGAIDTTDEHPPVRIALISVNKKLLELHLSTDQRNGLPVYEGDGYTLSFTDIKAKDDSSSEASFVISNKEKTSTYHVYGKRGYQ